MESAGADGGEQMLLAAVSAGLKTYRPETKVTLLLTAEDGGTEACPMTLADDGRYTARISLSAAALNAYYALALTAETDGIVTRETLREFTAQELLPVQCGGCDCGGYSSGGGALDIGQPSIYLYDANGNGAAVNDPAFTLYHNGKPVQRISLAEQQDGNYVGNDVEALRFGDGDTAELRFTCTDDTGLRYTWTVLQLSMTDSGPEEPVNLNYGFPTVSWD